MVSKMFQSLRFYCIQFGLKPISVFLAYKGTFSLYCASNTVMNDLAKSHINLIHVFVRKLNLVWCSQECKMYLAHNMRKMCLSYLCNLISHLNRTSIIFMMKNGS